MVFLGVEGILFALPEAIRYPTDLVHLWLHESSRVYSDKLMEEKDVELFNKILLDTGKRYFEVRNVTRSEITFSARYTETLYCALCNVCLPSLLPFSTCRELMSPCSSTSRWCTVTSPRESESLVITRSRT